LSELLVESENVLSLVCYRAPCFGMATWCLVTLQLCLHGALLKVGTLIVLSLLLAECQGEKLLTCYRGGKSQANVKLECFLGKHESLPK